MLGVIRTCLIILIIKLINNALLWTCCAIIYCYASHLSSSNLIVGHNLEMSNYDLMYVYMCVCVYICMYVYMYPCIYIYIYIYIT